MAARIELDNGLRLELFTTGPNPAADLHLAMSDRCMDGPVIDRWPSLARAINKTGTFSVEQGLVALLNDTLAREFYFEAGRDIRVQCGSCNSEYLVTPEDYRVLRTAFEQAAIIQKP